MITLAIETSGSVLSVALASEGRLVAEIFYNDGLVHSEKLIPAIELILNETKTDKKDLDKIAVSVGPGSFTGIRVGLSCARMMSQALNIPLAGINSLDILSYSVPSCGCRVIAAIDALRGEVYVKDARKGVVIKPVESFAGELKKIKSQIILAGNAVEVYNRVFKTVLKKKMCTAPDNVNFPRAGALALISQNYKGVKYDKVAPLYIRRSWAEENK